MVVVAQASTGSKYPRWVSEAWAGEIPEPDGSSHMECWQNHDSFLGTLNVKGRSVMGNCTRMIILTSRHMTSGIQNLSCGPRTSLIILLLLTPERGASKAEIPLSRSCRGPLCWHKPKASSRSARGAGQQDANDQLNEATNKQPNYPPSEEPHISPRKAFNGQATQKSTRQGSHQGIDRALKCATQPSTPMEVKTADEPPKGSM